MTNHYEEILGELVKGFGDWFGEDKTLEYARMTNQLYPYTRLFSPIQVNGVKIKNRDFAMGPMGIQMADELGRRATKSYATLRNA